MAFGNVPHASSGDLASSGDYNQLIDNVDNLDTRLDVTEALTTNTSGSVGTGNQRLSDRLGAGVTNASTATAQFSTLTTNVTTLQGQVGAAPSSPNLHSRVSTLEAASTVSPLVRCVRATNQTIGNNTGGGTLASWEKISWSSAPRNPNTMWAAGNPTRLTVPAGQGGLYFVQAAVLFAPNATNYRSVAALVSGTTSSRGMTLLNAGGNYTEFCVTWHLELTAGQYVEILVWQNSGGTLDVVSADGAPNVTMRKVAA